MKGKTGNSARETERLFKENYPLLCLVAFGILRDKDTAKDIVQDFFVSYWQRKDSVSISVSFRAYATKAIKNLSLLHLEKIRKEKVGLKDLETPQCEVQEIPDNSDRRIKLKALIERLPESRKSIFVSAIIDGQSYAQIAESRGISVNTVKTQMKRAYAFLRAKAPKILLLLFSRLL